MKICKYCKKEFKPSKHNPGQEFCSKICSRRHRYYNEEKKYKKTCKYCGKEYLDTHKDSLYCSRECWVKAITKNDKWGRYSKLYIKKCVVCNKEFITRFVRQTKTCSIDCHKKYNCIYNRNISINKHRNKEIKCINCGKSFIKIYGDKRRKYCSDDCHKQSEEFKILRRIAKQKRRANQYSNGTIEIINPIDVFNKDNWVCGICNKKISKKLKYPNLYSASLDHIIPLAKGGTHTLDNVQATHCICNIRKSDVINNIQLKLCG